MKLQTVHTKTLFKRNLIPGPWLEARLRDSFNNLSGTDTN